MTPNTERLQHNAQCIERELRWLEQLIEFRFAAYQADRRSAQVIQQRPPALANDASVYAAFLRGHRLRVIERLALILALAPHVRPQLFDPFVRWQAKESSARAEFGGWSGKAHGGFLPTLQTLAFVAGGTNLTVRFSLIELFGPDHLFARHDVLSVVHLDDHEPFFSGLMALSPALIERFTLGHESEPVFSTRFPARRIETSLDWPDLVIDENVEDEVQHIIRWIQHKDTIQQHWGQTGVIRQGYKALFHGPPGTGKSFTAALIGKATGRAVYRVDLSMVVSKWVGETEKNLARIFDAAENKDWILFFDEAEALFGKRTNTQSSQERYANQEVAYLLQRVEDINSTVILASNLKGNMDEAFIRRFHSIVYFPLPKPKQRWQMWQSYLGKCFALDDAIDLEVIANEYELTGANIVNVMKYCAIRAVEHPEKRIFKDDLVAGIRREIVKEGKYA